LLISSQTAPAERRPLLLLAADRVARRLDEWLGKPPGNHHLEKLAGYGLQYQWLELGGGWAYRHDLLGRIWRDYPASRWAEAAFALLLNQGWDTDKTCGNGSDQFRLVIRHGEPFLTQRPRSPQRAEVLFAVAQAYETWWSLSRSSVTDYVNPAEYQQGADRARHRAIAYYEELLQLAERGGYEARHTRLQLPRLKLGINTGQTRFHCVYD